MNTFFTGHCFSVNIRTSTSRKSIEILFEVCVFALIELTNHELWIMALQLLKSVQKIVKPDENRTNFVLISAEIYLANNNPVEVLYLLQSEWRKTFNCHLAFFQKSIKFLISSNVNF